MNYGYAHNRYFRGQTRRIPKVPRGRTPYRRYGKTSRGVVKPNPIVYPRYAGGMGPEYKLFDTTQSQPISDAGYHTTLLGSVASGSGFNQRVGNHITLKSYYLRATLTGDLTTGPRYNHLRLLLLLDKQANGALPTIASMFPANADKIVSPLDPSVADRYNIIHDKVYTLNDNEPSKFIKVFKKFNMPVDYASATTSVPTNNQIIPVWIGFDDEVLTTVIWDERIRYTDN